MTEPGNNERDARIDATPALRDLHALNHASLHLPGWVSVGAEGARSAARARTAAVLILFGVHDADTAHVAEQAGPEDLDLLLQVRAQTLSSHPGQISFPGGRAEPEDANEAATALREAHEETGVDVNGIDILHTFDPVPTLGTTHSVAPVVGWWREPSPIRAVDPAETESVHLVSVGHLLDARNRFSTVSRRGGREFRAPAFDMPFQGPPLWGFTAMVLSSTFDALGWTKPWDARGRTHEI